MKLLLALDNDKHGRGRFKVGVRQGKDVLAMQAVIHRSISSAITAAQIGKIGPHACPSTINKADSRWAGKSLTIDIKRILCIFAMPDGPAKAAKLRTGRLG